LVVKAVELVVQVTCLHCRHKSILSNQALASVGIKPEAPIATFVKRLRCSKCGSGSVVANRIATNEKAARRMRA
jgi:cytochrome c-type biogenesis protein CcmH/NrfF